MKTKLNKSQKGRLEKILGPAPAKVSFVGVEVAIEIYRLSLEDSREFPRSQKQEISEIKRVYKEAVKSYQALTRLNEAVIEASIPTQQVVKEVAGTDIEAVLLHFLIRLAPLHEIVEHFPRRQGGPRQKWRRANFLHLLMITFIHVTNGKPTTTYNPVSDAVSGTFLEFVKICGEGFPEIDDVSDNALRAAINRRRKSHSL